MADAHVYYSGIGKSLLVDGSVWMTAYGKDFNRSDWSERPTGKWNGYTASGETSYDLTGFQYGNEVCCYSITLDSRDTSGNGYIEMIFQKYKGGRQNAGWSDYVDLGYMESDYAWTSAWYVGTDSDEIRPDATRYRFLINWGIGSVHGTTTKEFTVSGLSFDTSLHPSGYMRVQGANLCYIDGSSGSRGYRHTIKYDGSYSGGNVGSENRGKIRLSSSSSDRHIYYVDNSGYVRRTTSADKWYGSSGSVGSSKKGYIWVSDGDMYDGYAHLCFVDGGGYKRRITNGGV